MSSAYDTAIAFMRQFHSPQVTIRPSIEAPHLVVIYKYLWTSVPFYLLSKSKVVIVTVLLVLDMDKNKSLTLVMSNVTRMLNCSMERLTFPWLAEALSN